MKKITICLISALAAIQFSCSPDSTEQELMVDDANFRVYESVSKLAKLENTTRNIESYCHTTQLIAGQHYVAGVVTVQRDGENLIITYSTNSDWTIGATHLSIGNCEDQSIPTNGGGNPKVGRFEHGTEHSESVNEVVYVLDASVLDDSYCFAAHAEVSGPTGNETAWAEGLNFDGNNWAMYVQALLSNCDVEEEPDGQVEL